MTPVLDASIYEHIQEMIDEEPVDVLVRYSGTEDLVRVMVEGPDEAWIAERAQALADQLVREIEATAGS